MTPAQWSTIHNLVAWLDRENGSDRHEITLRLLKLAEETGEVAQTWIGALGQNPRKGTTHTTDDVANELCDVIVTAAVALASITGADAERLFTAKLQQIADRAQAPEAAHGPARLQAPSHPRSAP
ncbi:MazG-like family protein [Streptomyces sp. URMC 123]|uniref:MazG-like family protein n=1 Tax=Streptomyces sp. URMC 123 TaxID=3423403 RepID=UPI003F1BAE82